MCLQAQKSCDDLCLLRKQTNYYAVCCNFFILFVNIFLIFEIFLFKVIFHSTIASYILKYLYFERLAQLFGVSEETFLKCTDVVMDALIANLHQIIRWPKPCEFEEFASEFEKVGRLFPNVIGAIDGLHLEIEFTEERRFEPSFIHYIFK